MTVQTELPQCQYRVPLGGDRIYCRHRSVHARDFVVNVHACRTCTWHDVPCYLPRPTQWEAALRTMGPVASSPLTFITSEQLVADTRDLLGRLPPGLAGIVGIPRSGMLPASLLAALLHVPLFTLCAERGIAPVGHGKRLASAERRTGPLLVIDDSVNGGYAMYQARQVIGRCLPAVEALFAALYVRPESAGCVDFSARLVPLPHLFEWNLANCLQAQGIALDFDGVLCEDFEGKEENEEEYVTFLRTAKPRWLPRRHPVPLIVTARLEKYRALTEEWLARHHIRVRSLIMGPWNSVQERRRHFCAKSHKAGPYAKSMCTLFIESDPRQAADIFEATGRPVLCALTGRVFQ